MGQFTGTEREKGVGQDNGSGAPDFTVAEVKEILTGLTSQVLEHEWKGKEILNFFAFCTMRRLGIVVYTPSWRAVFCSLICFSNTIKGK